MTERELQKAKNTALSDFYQSMKTIRDKANLLGYYELIFGDHRRLFTQVDLINKVTREDLQRVARQYFPDRNRTVAVLVPEKEPAEKIQP